MSAIPRKKRRTDAIEKSEKLFSEALSNQDYRKAANSVFGCLLIDFAKNGIMNALDDANSFIKRKELRRGL